MIASTLRETNVNRNGSAARAAIALAVALWSLLSLHAGAQPLARVEDGRRLAELLCSACHVVGPGATGPTTDAVPTFASVARTSSTTALSLRVFLQTPHARMPDIQLSRQDTEAIIAYILTLGLP